MCGCLRSAICVALRHVKVLSRALARPAQRAVGRISSRRAWKASPASRGKGAITTIAAAFRGDCSAWLPAFEAYMTMCRMRCVQACLLRGWVERSPKGDGRMSLVASILMCLAVAVQLVGVLLLIKHRNSARANAFPGVNVVRILRVALLFGAFMCSLFSV